MASSNFPVAVIGMTVRLPGAQSCDELWQLLINGNDTVKEFPSIRAADISHVVNSFKSRLLDKDHPFFTGSYFNEVDKFDADVFQINSGEAMFIEPEQRFFLEATWELLEDAGYASTIRGSRTGVYVGNTVNKYKYILTENHPSISHGNHSPFISSRISYTHDLQGPAMMVATGCSSSLLAVHVACQGLLSGDCDMAIAGGITLDLLPISTKTDIWNQLGITGPNVKCRAFDESANGIAKGEGCGVVLLKPLHKALEDGDYIYGILDATTANQDGRSNGITAPNPVSQTNMLNQAWKLADVSPEDLDYFEAHGTGTELGDPIEISGITNAFKKNGVIFPNKKRNKIPIGSVKANIGHLADGAAGVVSLIKTLLCINKNKIPAAVNFTTPNSHINWDKAPVYVNQSTLEWNPHTDESSRIASVSAFGLIGTNVHIVVREHIKNPEIDSLPTYISENQRVQVLVLSANSKASLLSFVGKLIEYFKKSDDTSYTMLTSVCFTINAGRENLRFKFRAVVCGEDWYSMLSSLEHCRATSTVSRRLLQVWYKIDRYACEINELNFLETDVKENIENFLKGKHVSWKECCLFQNRARKIPFVPTYAFERKRFWPSVGKTINMELLKLEHQMQENIVETGRVISQSEENICLPTSLRSHQIDEIIVKALNTALDANLNWNEQQNTNLLMLGLDSLMLSQVCTSIRDRSGCCISMTEFRQNPSFIGLKTLIKAKFNKKRLLDKSKGNNRTRSFKREDITYLLEGILNGVLGKVFIWKDLQNENLFMLGIDSLMYAQVNMKITEVFGVEAKFNVADMHKIDTFACLRDEISKKIEGVNQIVSSKSRFVPKTPDLSEGKQFPVSSAQRRLWVMQEMAIYPCAYNATNCIKITGNFHRAAFVLAVNTVLSRHGAFFTEFVEGTAGLMQRHIQGNNKLEEICLDLCSENAEASFMKLYDVDYKTAFDLRQSPLFRCKLYRMPDEVHFFTMVIHHIVFDGRSHFVFYNELWDSYQKICDGQKVSNSYHCPFYVEFSEEEQTDITMFSSAYENDIAYWKTQLSGDLPHTTFPGDKRRPAIFTYNGKRITHFLSKDVMNTLGQFSADRYTMFMKLLSAVYVLIYHYTGERDLIIGTPISGRPKVKYTNVIGCFINTLILRVKLEETFDFKDVLGTVANVCYEAYEHQRTPFDHLVSQLNLPRNTSTTPVFSINVCYHNTETKASHIDPPSDISVERRLIHNNSSKWDMQFDFLQEEEGMRFTLEYYSDVYSQTYAERVADSFINLLESVCSQPSIKITELPFSDVKPDNNDSASLIQGPLRDLGQKTLPHLLLESLSIHSNDSTVYNTDQTSLSYGSLMNKAEKVAVFLRGKCQNPKQSRIGLLLDNSVEALESILACMLAGLVYVPMDPASPKPRLEHMCKDAVVITVIFNKCHFALANHLHWACSSVKTIICIDSQQNYIDFVEDSTQSPLMDKELWNCVASESKNDIEGGGWKSSYTGEYMSNEEMKEYSENVLLKIKEYLNPDSSVLEIGCASGLTTKMICHSVKHYIATDLSQTMVEKLRNVYQEENNIEFYCTPADEIDEVCEGQKFDIIIMNSVVHCFPGYNYLRKVISICRELLADNGVVFIGDIMDLDCKDKLVASLKSFKESQPTCRVKTQWHNELFLSRNFLQHLCNSFLPSMTVSFSRKIHTISNELTEFRFDAIFTKTKMKQKESKNVHKIYTIRDVDQVFESSDSHMQKMYHNTVNDWSSDVDFKDEAYILYTSGTTGVPKGVIIGHEALLNYVSWACTAYKLDKKTCMPLFSPLTFDFTITSVFPPLLSGSSIRIFKSFQESYQEIAVCKHLTTVKFSPLQLDILLATAKDSLIASTFILGGEEVTPTLLSKLKKNKPIDDFVVWNEYGPTEATVGCVVKEISSDILPLHNSTLVPIGKPIDNVTVAVLGNNLKPLLQGAKGILGIGGKSLCSGFTDITGCSSIKAACWGRPGNQMLVTDDIVEVMPTSTDIVYFGRNDSESSKVNGIRVDLIEIQQAIETSTLVDSSWVSTFVFETKTYLGAAVKIKNTNTNIMPEKNWKRELMSSVSLVIPERSVPKVFVSVIDPPTNANGKKDTRLLKRLFAAEMRVILGLDKGIKKNASQECPATTKLQKIWQSILPINHLPLITENFFYDLSGDSLQAIHLTRKMRAEGFKVSVAEIFQNPTIEKLLPVISSKANESQHTSQKKEPTYEEEKAFRPTPIIEEFLRRDQLCPEYFSLSSLLKFHTKLKIDIVRKALRSVIRKHGSLRSRFDISDGKAVQCFEPLQPNEPKINEVSICSSEGTLTRESEFGNICDELEQHHSLSEGILINCAIIHFQGQTEGEYVLCSVHHIAVDIVSWQQILEDLALALKFLSDDCETEPVLAIPSSSFKDYCNALYKEASANFTRDLPYWTAVGRKCEVSGSLVEVHRQSKFESAKWETETVDAHVLRSISLKLGCSDEHILLTVFGRALSIAHGHNATAICLESHGRQLQCMDTTDTVGWFTSRFPFILETPVTGNLIKQVKSVEDSMRAIPSHGLSFGVLRSAGELSTPNPKIMFVFQGSLDASTKVMFDGGHYKFEHIPWIDVMDNELKEGRFHRHPEEVLEFDLEIIAWIHGGKLQLGCLFDEQTVDRDVVKEIVNCAARLINTLSTKINATHTDVSVEILAEFNIPPECVTTIKESLQHHDVVAQHLRLHPPEQFIQSLYKSVNCNADILVVIPRHKTDTEAKEFAKVFDEIKTTITTKTVVLIDTETIPNTASSKSFIEVDVRVQTPAFIGVRHYDSVSDEVYHMPFTRIGYTHFGLTIAKSINAQISKSRYKAIAVDADYTLWEGECAQGQVTLTLSNIALQEYLMKQKERGMLLVLLSKNNENDIDQAFAQQMDCMTVKKNDFVFILANWESKAANIRSVAEVLKIGLESFVFIDDNALECEEMLKYCPSVLTLQLPSSSSGLILPFIKNLWALDATNSTSESRDRTEMYRSEFARQKELQTVKNNDSSTVDLTEILRNWEMKLCFCKSSVASIKNSKQLYARVSELLQRTNQFKLNDINIIFDQMSTESQCWLVGLSDKLGSYGIVSVCIFSDDDNSCSTVSQWVVSCRALGRYVEHRILTELYRFVMSKDSTRKLRVAVNKTTRNTSLLNFFTTLGVRQHEMQPQVCHIDIESTILQKNLNNLHSIEYEVQQKFERQWCQKKENKFKSTRHLGKLLTPSLNELTEWVDTSWSTLQKDQATYHNMYPIIPKCSQLQHTSITSRCESMTQRENILMEAWMETLQCKHAPQDQSNFFEHGGNSFKAVFLVSKLRRACSVDVNIVDILKNPVYRQIRMVVQRAKAIDDHKPQMSTNCHKRFPLSLYQQRMVILQQTSPKSTAYVETVFCCLSKNIEPSEAIKSLAVMHPILTSKIEMSNDNKMYTMNVTGETLFDTESETLNENDNLNAYLIASTPIINVISSPLYRFRHIFTAKNISFFVLHVHHVIVDDVTLQALAKDLQAIATGTLPQSGPHAYHYSEYVDDEQMYMTTVQYESDKIFWTKVFSSVPPDATLTTQSKSENRQTSAVIYKAREEVWDLPKEMMKEITKYCKVLEVTHFQYFLSCTSLVLQRYLGVDDFIIAIPVTTRSDMSMKADGLFINTVLFRVAVNKNQTLQEFVKNISVEWLKTLCHSRYPLDQVAKSLWKENDRSLDTLCSVMFNFTTHCQTDERSRIGSKHAKMPLSLDIIYNEKTDSCKLICEWADGLIDSGTAKRLSKAVAIFSREGFQTTEMLFEREILSHPELQLLLSFNADPDHSEKYHLPVHKEFEKYAERDAKATAVFFNENSISYGNLNAISTRIAHFLSKSLSGQVLQQSPVVIVMEKDQNAIASILGIWKAGGHFLPVALSNETCLKDIFDCETPAALLYNVEIPTIKFVSTRCPVWSVEDILKFSQEAQVVKKYNESRPTGGDIAYVIMTSGSTGKPKRCQISHKSLWIIAEAWKQKYSMSNSVINVLQWAPLSFDVFIGDVVRALVCVQGKLIICPDNRRLDIPYIRNLIKNQQVTLFETTPQFGLQIINNSDEKDLESLKVFILGSDVLQEHVYKQIRCRLRSDQRLINSYGMTEATIDSSFFEGDEVPITRSRTVPIGKPLPGVMMYILDSNTLQPCPVGTIGELYISGDILATGDVKMVQVNYFQKQALKTGDSARWLPTGDIELIGRLDNIVKLRGFRISTTEIENKIVGLIDGVKEAHVTVISNDEKSGIEFLCAFLVIEEGFQQENTITHQRVSSKLRSQIPYYMLPDKIQIIREVPLTSHGKVNRKAFQNIVHTSTLNCHTEQIDENTATIMKLKEWFAEALDLEHRDLVSNSRTFMEQGGHSLILVRFWSLITSKSTFKIEIADLFSYPTISSLAEFIESQEKVRGCMQDYPRPKPFIEANSSFNEREIAITGIGLRLPGGVMSLAELWQVLQKGEDLIGKFPEQRRTDVFNCLCSSTSSDLMAAECFEGAFLSEIDQFDHGFFKIAPGEAKFMSPEQRLFLQVATEALAEGNGLSTIQGSKVGVFVGSSDIGYARLNHPDSAVCLSGLMPGMIATRVAYQWDLKGPTMMVDTACSSSLMALKLACESIKRNECDGALVGGVNIVFYPSKTGVFGQTSILSPDFHCKAFDKNASGTAVGEGVLCLYLEPLDMALSKGKPIYAIVKSVASNSVGHGNGITAPSSSSQVKVIHDALKAAKLNPSDITFVEGHGTGTNLGDKIELAALSTVFREGMRTRPLPVGASKSMFGHLDSAAGLLGVFRVLACMAMQSISQTANFKIPHSEFTNSPLCVPSANIHWETNENSIRAAGVSAYGLTGTNCHAILVQEKSSSSLTGDYKMTSFPLIFVGETLVHMINQAALYKVYIEKMAVRLHTGLIEGLCLTVATRLKEYQCIRKNTQSWRMVLDARTTEQLLKLLDMISTTKEVDYIMRLSTVRSDIHLRNSQHNLDIHTQPYIRQFLEDGVIDISRLFNDNHTRIIPALGVNVAFYQESRHWLDVNSSQEERTLYKENFLDIFKKK